MSYCSNYHCTVTWYSIVRLRLFNVQSMFGFKQHMVIISWFSFQLLWNFKKMPLSFGAKSNLSFFASYLLMFFFLDIISIALTKINCGRRQNSKFIFRFNACLNVYVKWVYLAEAYSEPSKTSQIEFYMKIFNSSNPLLILLKSSNIDVWEDSECASNHERDCLYFWEDLFQRRN